MILPKIHKEKPKRAREGTLWEKDTKKGKVLLERTDKPKDDFGAWKIIGHKSRD